MPYILPEKSFIYPAKKAVDFEVFLNSEKSQYVTRSTASKFSSFSGLLHYVRNDVHSKALFVIAGACSEAIQLNVLFF
jgi:hypothetical protein